MIWIFLTWAIQLSSMDNHSFAAYFNDASDAFNSEVTVYDVKLRPKLAKMELSPHTTVPFDVEHYIDKALKLTGAYDFTVERDENCTRFLIPFQNLQIHADENRICLSSDRFSSTGWRPA